MAQSLLESFSAQRCVMYAKRHIRLTKQIPGAHSLSLTFDNDLNNVQQLITALNVAFEEKTYIYDLTVFKDVTLDNCIRDTANACKKFDRDNLGANTFNQVFPDTTMAVITTHHLKEPAEVRKVISRINNLGPDHILKKWADELLVCVTDSEETVTKYYEAIQKVANCQVDLTMAKFNLVRAYNSRILDAIKLFGRKNVNKLFPQVRDSSSDETDEEIPEEDAVENAV